MIASILNNFIILIVSQYIVAIIAEVDGQNGTVLLPIMMYKFRMCSEPRLCSMWVFVSAVNFQQKFSCGLILLYISWSWTEKASNVNNAEKTSSCTSCVEGAVLTARVNVRSQKYFVVDLGSRAVEVVWRISRICVGGSWGNWVNSPSQCGEISTWCDGTYSQASRSAAAWMRTGDSASKYYYPPLYSLIILSDSLLYNCKWEYSK